MNFKTFKEKFVESIIYFSGVFSSLVVLLIIVFLFNEGSGLFDRKPLEEGFSLVLNPKNNIEEISATDIRKIIEKDYTNWSQLGGFNREIIVFDFSELEEYFTFEELGDDFEKLPDKIEEFVLNNEGVFAVFPSSYIKPSLEIFELEDISLVDYFTGRDWYPTAEPSPQLGALPIIMGTFWVTLGAMVFALPIGMSVSIYLAEIATKKERGFLKPIIELLAGIPSIVYGFFGLVLIVPFLQETFDLPVGETALAGSILLAMISLPTIISLADDAIRSTPTEIKQASLALGASRWQSMIRVIIPYSASGIASACILGMGRAIGETMAVLMVTGNSAVMPTSFLKPVRTITATIAAELGEAPVGGIHYEALFIMGAILFIFTFFINLIAGIIAQKTEAK
ncbi:MAG TPA: phosphate ABC transporter permease subunit PstC [Cyclobacteriaceae bacterium]